MQYEKLYAEMVGAAEQAIEAIEHGNYGQAKDILIAAASQGKSMNRFINDAIDAQMPPEKTEE